MLATPARRALQRYLTWWDRLWLRLFNRSVGGWIGRAPVLVLHTTGRKSGRRTATALCYVRDGRSLIVGGGSTGSQRNPGWYYNLRATPETAVTIDRATVRVTAELLAGAERAEAWRKINEAMPYGAAYERKVSREIPVFRLTPRD
jgi:deazaflavin-dependent oxidoreductase (nitroreductase family)